MGSNITAGGYSSYAFGKGVSSTTSASGTIMFGDNSGDSHTALNPNEMFMRFKGGYRLLTGTSSGVKLAPGAGAWASLSDRRMKENFSDLNGEEVLTKLEKMSVTTWNYKSQDKTVRHAGPMAQDFYEAFGLGGTGNDTTITTTDIDGINLAAIKALAKRTGQLNSITQELQRQTAALAQLQGEYAQLKELVLQLEARINISQAPAATATTNQKENQTTR
jgi:hypothetical protein